MTDQARSGTREILSQETLERFRKRAAGYDAENAFFVEDFEDLRAAGYLAAPVPSALGGGGANLETLSIAQRRLASAAPATALGVNMHLVWVQAARFLHDRGVHTLDWVLREAVAGEVFAFGISEAGNDAVLMDSLSRAEPQADGGYLVTGSKTFTTLSPVWTRLGVHARITAEPLLMFGFVRRDEADNTTLAAGTIEHPGHWNPLGMRATQSYLTQLDRVRVAPEDIAAIIPVFDDSDPLTLAMFSSFSLLTAAVYAGIADRALELATQAARRPAVLPAALSSSCGDLGAAADGQPTARAETSNVTATIRLDDPDTASRLTAATLAHRASLDALTVLARDVDQRRDRSDWFLALAAMRNRVTDEARSAVEVALRTVGASGYQADSELARLYRDVLAGLFHPSSSRALAKSVRDSLR